MVLAQVPGAGLSCFLLPRVLPDGTRNGMRLQRLKDKLGNRSNASAEVEYDERDGLAGRRGGPGRPHHPRDGQLDPARLRARRRDRDAAGRDRRPRTTPRTGPPSAAP